MPDNVIEIRGLTRQFGPTRALNNLEMTIPSGLVYGLVGANGAGKTTLIKHILGLLRPQSGSVSVFGMDPISNPVEVLGRIGYLSEARALPEWMRIDQLMRYTQAYYPKWDQSYADELAESFALDLRKKIKELSKGMRAQAGLILAVAAKPDLLLLDEPSTGLDAIVRRDILNAIIRTVADDGRTVLFSSHLLDEVEQMSDHVLMINSGEWVLQGSLDDVKDQHHNLVVEFDSPRTEFPSIDGSAFDKVLSAEPGICPTERVGDGAKTWRLVCCGDVDRLKAAFSESGGQVKQTRGVSLEEIFIARVGRARLALVEAT